MRWHPKIHHFVLTLVVVAATPLLCLGLWQGRRIEQEARTGAVRDLLDTAQDVAHDVTALIQARMDQLTLIATRAADLPSWTETERLRGLFDGRYAPSGFGILYLGDRWGTALFASPARSPNGVSYAGINYSDRAFFHRLQATGRPAIGDATIGRSHRNLTIAAAAPVFRPDGALRGHVAGSMQLEPLYSVLEDDARRAQARIVLTDERSVVIADSDHLAPPLSSWPVPWSDTQARYLADPATGNKRYQVTVELPLPGTTWRAFVSVTEAAALATAERQRRSSLQATALALLSMLTALYGISALATRDLRRLADAARQLGMGDYHTRLDQSPRLTPLEVLEVWESLRAAAGQLAERRAERDKLIHDLQASNESMRTFATGVRDAQDGVLVLDREHRVQFANDAWLRMHQVHAEDVAGKDIAELQLSDDPGRLALRDSIERGDSWRGILRIRRTDGAVGEAEVTLSPVRGDDGAIERYVALVRDVTAQRKADLAMQQTERLASLGLLAAGVAHEINNPMTYVLGNLEELGELARAGQLSISADAGLDLTECLDDCLHGSRRVIEIVRDLRQLSQLHRESAGEAAQARDVVESCLRVATSQLRHVEVVRDLPDAPLSLRISEQHLGQVFLNLLVNAGQAMSPTRPNNQLRVRLRQLDSARAELSVSDNGCGMTQETLRKIFDPFFTTKRPGLGTGLGLSICRSLVEAAHGEIQVDSEVDKGSCFRVVLPLAIDLPNERRAQAEFLQGLRILVVDDEPGVLTTLQRMLAPCETAGAGSVADALTLVARQRFDVVLSDVMMAQQTGVDLVRALQDAAPALARRTCLMSGGVLGAEMAAQLEALRVPLLHKPFSREELHRALLLLRADDASPQPARPATRSAVDGGAVGRSARLSGAEGLVPRAEHPS